MSDLFRTRSIQFGLGDVVTTINVPAFGASWASSTLELVDFKPGASYNWVGTTSPTSRSLATRPQFVDQNAARNLTSPLAPLVLETKHCTPPFDFRKVDVITDRKIFASFSTGREASRSLAPSFRSYFDRADAYTQLFFSRTLSLYLARHSRDRFTTVEKLALAEMSSEERGARVAARKLAEVLREIKKFVGEEGERARLSLVWEGVGAMKVYRRTTSGDAALPDELAKELL